MNQTKKRLKIINIAISITDIETIQLQIFKLSPLKTDLKIQEIIIELQAENYAHAQELITTYINIPTEEILQRTSQEKRVLKDAEEKDIIDEFDLFVTSPTADKTAKKEMYDFSKLEEENHSRKKDDMINFDSLLHIEVDNILSDNPQNTDNPKIQSKNKKNIYEETNPIPKDNFFDIEESLIALEIETEKVTIEHVEKELTPPTNSNHVESHIDIATIPRDTFFDIKETSSITKVETEELDQDKIMFSKEKINTISQKTLDRVSFIEKNSSKYEAIPYIDQKFKNMHTQYPPKQTRDDIFPSANAWLRKISTEGYSNDEVEEVVNHIMKLTETNNLAEAAELLLITGATKSKFAQFILARALYKGELLQKNLPESFTLINRLAIDDDYPEAICDLAQFYEHGIGIDKDKKRAEILYKEAMDLGIERAIEHHNRLKKQNRGFFSIFKK